MNARSLLSRSLLAAMLAAQAAPALADDGQTSCKYIELASVPLRYTGPGLGITTDGVIDGTPAQVLVDTGAHTVALTRTGTDKRKLPLRSLWSKVYGVGGLSRLYSTRLREFSIGPAKAASGQFKVIGDMGGAPSFEAIAGAPFLLQTDLEISLSEKKMRFFRPQDCAGRSLAYWDPDAVEIPFDSGSARGTNPHFTVTVNGVKLDAIIDSGAAVTVIDSSAAKRAGLRLDSAASSRVGLVSGVGERKVAHWATVADTMVIGTETISNAELGVIETDGNLGVDLLLGADFLRAHRVLFAMSQRRLYLSYIGGDPFRQRKTIEPWMLSEAEQGNPDAQMVLASMYGMGRGVPKDTAQADAWLAKAAAQGHGPALLATGRKLMGQRKWAEASTQLRAALDKLPAQRTAALWLYTARLNNGQPDLARTELEAAFAGDERDDWPAPVADFYLGRIDVPALLELAAKESKLAKARTCSANAHMAELYAARGDHDKARSAAETVRVHCGTGAATAN